MNYIKFISKKVQKIKPSGIRKYFENSPGVISLGVGEPDFSTPKSFCEAAIKSIKNKETFYTSNWGLLSLRKDINKYLNNRYLLQYNPENEIVITSGTSEALDLSLRTLINPGDEVLIPEPSYVAYEPGVILSGGKPVFVNTKLKNKFKITYDDLKSKITSKTKVLILPYPCNPTGAIMKKEELKNIVELVKKYNLFVISDELYSELTYCDNKHFSFSAFPEMQKRTLLINGFSKSFAMTGWRLGYVCGPKEIMKELIKIHQYTMLCAPIMAQRAAEEALCNGLSKMKKMIEIYDKRRKFLIKNLNNIGLKCFEPEGAFYIFPSVENLKINGEQFADLLLKKEKVAIIPGGVFGPSGNNHVRICYAYSMKEIEESLKRIDKFIKKFLRNNNV